MSGNNLLVDTNFLIYLLNGNAAVAPYLKNNFFVSDITEMEMLGVKNLDSKTLIIRKLLIENCFIVNFNSDIKEIAIRIKQKSTIKLPDAIVAASSMYMGFPLVTADKGFTKIAGLDLKLLQL